MVPPLDGALVGRLLGEGSASAAAVRKPRSETRVRVSQLALERTSAQLYSTVFRCIVAPSCPRGAPKSNTLMWRIQHMHMDMHTQVLDWADAWRAGAADPRSFAASRLILLSDPQGTFLDTS